MRQKVNLYVCAYLTTLYVHISLRLFGYKNTFITLKRWRPKQRSWNRDAICDSVQHAASFIPGALCLAQALAAQHLLKSVGVYATMKVGSRLNGGRDFEAHAWLVHDKTVILGARGINLEEFQVMTEFSCTP